MQKIILPIIMIFCAYSAEMYGQTGINTANPVATLDVVAKAPTGTSKTAEGLLVPRVDRERAQNMTGVATSTLIYINSISTGTQTGTTVNVDAAGYYYYNGTAWSKLNSATAGSVNLYNTDGTVTGNRTVTQDDKTLAFTGTAVNAFSVDGTTLSIDAANNRVGIGINAPGNTLHVANSSTNPYSGIASFMHSNGIAGVGIGYDGIQKIGSRTNLDLTLDAKGSGNVLLQTQATGNVGIGTTDPQTKLDIVTANDYGWQHSNGTVKLRSYLDSSSGWIGTSSSHSLIFMTGDQFKALIDINGNMGIGTKTPAQKLHVVGAARISGSAGTATAILGRDSNGDISNLNLGSGLSITGGALNVSSGSSSNIYSSDGTLSGNRTVTQADKTLAFTGTAANAFSVDGSTLSVDAWNDRIGIGTTAPQTKMDIVTGNDYGWQHSNGTVKLRSYISSSGGWIGTNTPHNLIFMTGDQFKAIIDTNGNMGIGTSTPQKKMHVNGALQVTNELNVGGSDSVAGNAGTDGQVLTSKGPGTAPVWQNISSPFIPKIVVSGRTTSNQTVAGGGVFRPYIWHSIAANDGNWNTSTNTYTVPTSGYYQVSMTAGVQPNKLNSGTSWVVNVDGQEIIFNEFRKDAASVIPFRNSGGTFVLYLNAYSQVQFGSNHCYGCNNPVETYDIKAGASFAILAIGN
ncbi:hypothetical protein [Chryseobacterium sp. JM1]|uniref:hypothetical protein n=1 Tax=Chryseobacterium sp. JM1 TaxID=1233950 RepID=UPI000A45346E|nr:hypothetical protein [Chryseobacterium sp. JM1]